MKRVLPVVLVMIVAWLIMAGIPVSAQREWVPTPTATPVVGAQRNSFLVLSDATTGVTVWSIPVYKAWSYGYDRTAFYQVKPGGREQWLAVPVGQKATWNREVYQECSGWWIFRSCVNRWVPESKPLLLKEVAR